MVWVTSETILWRLLIVLPFSTIIGWYFFSEANALYLFGKGIIAYQLLVLGFILYGTTQGAAGIRLADFQWTYGYSQHYWFAGLTAV